MVVEKIDGLAAETVAALHVVTGSVATDSEAVELRLNVIGANSCTVWHASSLHRWLAWWRFSRCTLGTKSIAAGFQNVKDPCHSR